MAGEKEDYCLIFPNPMSRHLCPTLRLMATRDPTSAQTGLRNAHLIKFLPSSLTTPTVAAELTFNINISPSLIGSTTSLSFAPTTLSNKCGSNFSSYQSGGASFGRTIMLPTSLSLLTTLGSSGVNIAIEPPGTAELTFSPPVMMLRIFACIGFQIFWFFSVTSYPGTISMSSPSLSVPSLMEPPKMPPTSFSGVVPGLLTSNERAMNIFGFALILRSGVLNFS